MADADGSVIEEFARSQRELLTHRYGLAIDRSQRVMDRWEARWMESHLEGVPTLSDPDIELLIRASGHDSRPVTKAFLGPRLRAASEKILEPMRDRVLATHRWFTREVSEDAGQHALDLLGVNATWSWEPRSASDKLVSAKGSAAIEGLYGKHVDRLTSIVQEATSQRSPLSPAETAALIRDEWAQLTRSQAELIARTETAHMWEATSFVASVGNGIDKFDWIVAIGPSVGSDSVCRRCLAIASLNPYDADKVPLPPRHPLCRCTLVPSLAFRWGIPTKPWTGGSPA